MIWIVTLGTGRRRVRIYFRIIIIIIVIVIIIFVSVRVIFMTKLSLLLLLLLSITLLENLFIEGYLVNYLTKKLSLLILCSWNEAVFDKIPPF